MLRDALLENLHRSQLNPLEEAAAYQQLLEDFGCTHEELAARIGRSRPQISNTIRLLKLAPAVQRRVAAGVLSAGHARSLLAVEDPELQDRLAARVDRRGHQRARPGGDRRGRRDRRRPERAGCAGAKPTAPGLAELADRLSDRLETRVKVDLGRRKGKITVEFATSTTCAGSSTSWTRGTATTDRSDAADRQVDKPTEQLGWSGPPSRRVPTERALSRRVPTRRGGAGRARACSAASSSAASLEGRRRAAVRRRQPPGARSLVLGVGRDRLVEQVAAWSRAAPRSRPAGSSPVEVQRRADPDRDRLAAARSPWRGPWSSSAGSPTGSPGPAGRRPRPRSGRLRS